MNRGEIRTRILEALREDTASPGGWTIPEINNYIDDGYGMLAEATKAVVQTVVLPATPKYPFIQLPPNCIVPMEMKDTASGFPIDPVEYHWIDANDPEWIRAVSDRPRYAAAFALEELLIYPSYSGSGSVTATLAIYPDPITSDATVPDVPEDYHQALVYYGHHRALLRDAHTPEILERAMRPLRLFVEALGGLDGWTDTRLGNLRFGVGFGPRLRTPSSITEGAGD